MGTNTKLAYRKMNGLGNDFVVLDLRACNQRLTPSVARALANRDRGIGCDQVITLEPARAGGHLFMGIYNPDGSEAGACGNATRCVAQLFMDEQGASGVMIETLGGHLACWAAENGLITVDMGQPRLGWQDIPLARAVPDTAFVDATDTHPEFRGLPAFSAVNVGNPHAVFFVPDIDRIDVPTLGRAVERSAFFPEGANISFCEVGAPNLIRTRVWERGAGLTLACGSAACAIAVSGVRQGLTERDVTIRLPGGDLRVEWRDSDGHIVMTGPTSLDYQGEIDLSTFGSLQATA